PNITCSENFNYHHGLIDSLWSQVVEEDFQDDFFDDSFSWLEDETIWAEDTTISEDVLLEGIGMCLSHLMDSVTEKGHHFCSISSQNKDYFDTLSKVYGRAKFIHVIDDPREAVLEKNITDPEEIKKYLLEWSQSIELVRSQCESLDQNYIEMTIPLLKKYPKEEMARLLAFLGQTWEEEVIDELANLDSIQALGTLSNEQASIIEGNIGELLTNFGFELSHPS
ncbi:MAG: sulfotransferase, partial [Myxococcota bacterium]|nr:sulfotransferase [Myxococcota bacterium]